MQVTEVAIHVHHVAYAQRPTHIVSLGEFLVFEHEGITHFQVLQLTRARARNLFLIIENEEGSVGFIRTLTVELFVRMNHEQAFATLVAQLMHH
jgi:hypothetical protein